MDEDVKRTFSDPDNTFVVLYICVLGLKGGELSCPHGHLSLSPPGLFHLSAVFKEDESSSCDWS